MSQEEENSLNQKLRDGGLLEDGMSIEEKRQICAVLRASCNEEQQRRHLERNRQQKSKLQVENSQKDDSQEGNYCYEENSRQEETNVLKENIRQENNRHENDSCQENNSLNKINSQEENEHQADNARHEKSRRQEFTFTRQAVGSKSFEQGSKQECETRLIELGSRRHVKTFRQLTRNTSRQEAFSQLQKDILARHVGSAKLKGENSRLQGENERQFCNDSYVIHSTDAEEDSFSESLIPNSLQTSLSHFADRLNICAKNVDLDTSAMQDDDNDASENDHLESFVIEKMPINETLDEELDIFSEVAKRKISAIDCSPHSSTLLMLENSQSSLCEQTGRSIENVNQSRDSIGQQTCDEKSVNNVLLSQSVSTNKVHKTSSSCSQICRTKDFYSYMPSKNIIRKHSKRSREICFEKIELYRSSTDVHKKQMLDTVLEMLSNRSSALAGLEEKLYVPIQWKRVIDVEDANDQRIGSTLNDYCLRRRRNLPVTSTAASSTALHDSAELAEIDLINDDDEWMTKSGQKRKKHSSVSHKRPGLFSSKITPHIENQESDGEDEFRCFTKTKNFYSSQKAKNSVLEKINIYSDDSHSLSTQKKTYSLQFDKALKLSLSTNKGSNRFTENEPTQKLSVNRTKPAGIARDVDKDDACSDSDILEINVINANEQSSNISFSSRNVNSTPVTPRSASRVQHVLCSTLTRNKSTLGDSPKAVVKYSNSPIFHGGKSANNSYELSSNDSQTSDDFIIRPSNVKLKRKLQNFPMSARVEQTQQTPQSASTLVDRKQVGRQGMVSSASTINLSHCIQQLKNSPQGESLLVHQSRDCSVSPWQVEKQPSPVGDDERPSSGAAEEHPILAGGEQPSPVADNEHTSPAADEPVEHPEPQIECPLCNRFFPLKSVEIHASNCNGSERSTVVTRLKQRHQQVSETRNGLSDSILCRRGQLRSSDTGQLTSGKRKHEVTQRRLLEVSDDDCVVEDDCALAESSKRMRRTADL